MAVMHGGNIFRVAEQRGVPWQQVIDFSASINPLGPSPAAREAILAAMDRIAHYPERTGESLCRRLAAEWSVGPEQVLVGNGATELLFDWCRFYGTGTIATPAFGEFHRAWPEAELCQLADSKTWPSSGPVVLTRPANPSGTMISADEVALYASKRSDAVLVDESFIDFCPDAASVTQFAKGNLFVLRSLTKFWALPGLRIGALVGDVESLQKLRPPWPVNALAEAAALASVEDRDHAALTRAFVQSESEWLAVEFNKLPTVKVWPVVANYLYIELPQATQLTEFAAARNVLLRDCSSWPGFARPSIRVAVRRRWENELLLTICQEFLCV